jgi:peroxiredoxin Q/BCP
VIVGVSCDTPAENRAFREKFDFPYDLLCDEDRTVSMTYGAAESADQGYPARISYLLDPDGRVAKAYPKVDAASHPEQVLQDLP